MIIVGIDFGDARTGISVCDKYEMMATEAGCVHADSYKKALAAVGEKVVELKAELIVVGNPTEMYDERLTTVSAHKILNDNNVRGKKRKATVDALSARLILEDYLRLRKNRQNAD